MMLAIAGEEANSQPPSLSTCTEYGIDPFVSQDTNIAHPALPPATSVAPPRS
jgi:hypothetical protein